MGIGFGDREWMLIPQLFPTLVIQSDIESRGRMSKRTDADAIHAGFGNRANRAQIYSAGRLQLHIWRSGIPPANSFAHLVKRHIVEQNDIPLTLSRPLQLF